MNARATCVALGALLLLLSGVSGPRALAQQRPFVTVQGTRFMVGQRPFQFVGANLNVMHGPKPRSQAPATIKAAARDGLTVGRVWALGEGLSDAPSWTRKHYLFRAGPDGWQPAALLQLDRVVAEAAKHGLRLIITLSNHWKDYGGVPMYLRWAGEVDVESYGYDDRFYGDPRCRKWFLEHARRIVTRVNSITRVAYRDDPTIFAWELQNEMNGTPEAAPVRRRWVVEMSRAIRELDPNHLVVPGLIGYNLQLERRSWIRMCRLPEVAFCDQHIYPQEHLRSRGLRNLRRYIDDRVQLAHHVVGKPIVFGEFGFADRGPAARRAWWHARFLERLFYDGGNGALVWIYQPTLSWTRRYGVLVDRARYRPVRRALARRASMLARGEALARNPILSPERGTRPIAPTHVTQVRWRGTHRIWRAAPGARVLSMAVDRFYRAHFEEAGSWDGGILVHTYGRRTGWFDYRFAGPGKVPQKLTLHLRLSSEYPSSSAPPDGFSRVRLLLDDDEVARLRVMPDDGVGRWYVVDVTQGRTLRRIARGTHRLRLWVVQGEEANGVAIYGREAKLNREPVTDPGPLRLVAQFGGRGASQEEHSR